MLLHLTKINIKYWVDLNPRDFAEIENQNPNFLTNDWMDRYIHDSSHEWLFYEFPIIRLTYKNTNHQGGESMSWTLELLQELQ